MLIKLEFKKKNLEFKKNKKSPDHTMTTSKLEKVRNISGFLNEMTYQP